MDHARSARARGRLRGVRQPRDRRLARPPDGRLRLDRQWTGARIVAIAMDPNTGLPVPSNNLTNEKVDTGAMVDFATGWDDGSNMHGRPAAVTFSPDGRLFVANNNNGVIFWIVPM
jgi:hypothetical protein